MSLLGSIFTLSPRAQSKEYNTWMMGFGIQIDFNGPTPQTSLNNTISALEGSAAISDKNTGQLLFYTDGLYCWDRQNNILPALANGQNILGGSFSNSQVLIVPQPGQPSLYYLFTVPLQAGGSVIGTGSDTLFYNIVDMTQNGGLGDLVQQNIPLLSPSTEKLCAIRQPDSDTIWILTHEWNSNKFLCYPLSASGLGAPVISQIGQVHSKRSSFSPNAEAIGWMQFSPQGNQVACVMNYDMDMVELFDFDIQTGQLSQPRTDSLFRSGAPDGQGLYACAFSPDGEQLYVSGTWYDSVCVYQYPTRECKSENFTSSRKRIFYSDTLELAGAMQLAPNGVIYLTRLSSLFLDAIQNPNASGSACNYTVNALPLASLSSSSLGMCSMVWDAPARNPMAFQFKLQFNSCTGEESIQFQPTGVWNIKQWKVLRNGTEVYRSNSALASYSNTEPGNYEFILEIQDACADTLKTMNTTRQVDCAPISDPLYIPNAFTPNGDGLNDSFNPLFSDSNNNQLYYLIFNRWGESVFDSRKAGANQGWNGIHRGEAAEVGTYFYLVQAQDGSLRAKGDVLLIR